MGGRDHHRWESVGPRDIDCTFLYEIRKKFDVRKRLLWSRIAENATEVKAVGKSSIIRDLCFSLCKRLLSCSTLVCEVTTPSLHSQILRSARGLLLRLNAIALNPLPFWLKILETFLFPPSLTPIFRFHDFLCFLSATNRPGIGRSSGHRLYISVRNTKEVRCQKETPMESHRRKRHRSESSWKKLDHQRSMLLFV